MPYISTTWTDPVCDAVCWKWIVIPVEVAFFLTNPDKLSSTVGAKSAVALTSLRDMTFVHAYITFDAIGISRWLQRKVKLQPRSPMDFLYMWLGLFEFMTDAFKTDP